MTEATAELAALVDAAWQVLDDMGTHGLSCCRAAKAQLRVAIEPFKLDEDGEEMPLDMPLAEAEAILEEVRNG